MAGTSQGTLITRQPEHSAAVCERLTKRLSDGGHKPKVQKLDVGRETLMHLVALGLGVSLTSEATVASSFPDVVFRPIVGDDELVQFHAVWLSNNDNPALRRFLSLARAQRSKRNGIPALLQREPRAVQLRLEELACLLAFSSHSPEGSVCRHESCQHRRHELCGLKGLSSVPAEHLGVSNEVAMDRGRQLNGELYWLVVRKGGELELRHRDPFRSDTAPARGRD